MWGHEIQETTRDRGLRTVLRNGRAVSEHLSPNSPVYTATLATTVVRRHVTLQLQHHDQASLLAGKLHAVLHRDYVKGRDLYDLLWYLIDPAWPTPNLTLLNNALRQTSWDGAPLTQENWRDVVRQRVATFDWPKVVADVRPFLEREAGMEILTRENVLRLLET